MRYDAMIPPSPPLPQLSRSTDSRASAVGHRRPRFNLVVLLRYRQLVLVYTSWIPCTGVRVTGSGSGASVGRRGEAWEGLRWGKRTICVHVERFAQAKVRADWARDLLDCNQSAQPVTGVSHSRSRRNTDAHQVF